ncbi:MAG: chemotaxis protein [Desulfobulbaceae bacterium]|nr:MAG: chemotaxis protein [Desulfobulbaceae bacterium]
MDLKQWSLRGKIVLVGVLLPTLLIVVLMRLYISEAREKTVESFAAKARGICLTAESTREEMEAKWALGLFSTEQVRRYADQGRRDKVLATVPVVSAWQAAMRKAEEGDYTFKVPKFSPRNPKNEPDRLEAKALNYMKDNQVDEYYEVDPTINAVRYFRAIKLSETCLLCHGDPADSERLWGNSRGIDPTDGPMENWKVGEIHGAFEVIQSLEEADRQLASSIKKASQLVMIGLAVMAIFFATLVIRIVSNSVIKPIKRIINDLTANSSNLLDASNMVASASTQLADGASQQAASVEETSASLEETSSMIKLNADNVSQTSLMAESAKSDTEIAQSHMDNMTDAIDKIKKSADETAVIMKTIDEIAFQTNLLALNAAVEAARAGEAGAGFAVVADEVRSLALRSAEAARTTAALIEQSQHNADNGVQAATGVKEILTKIAEGVTKVSALAKEISVASTEQAEGVNQINIAISEVDKVTQETASISEQSASASEELSGQARELNELVSLLADIVGARQAPATTAHRRKSPQFKSGRPHPSTKSALPPTPAKGKDGKGSAASRSASGKAKEVIPFDDDDFEDF